MARPILAIIIHNITPILSVALLTASLLFSYLNMLFSNIAIFRNSIEGVLLS